MFSVNNFYNYLNEYLRDNKKHTSIKSFNKHGSRLLKDIIVPSFKIDMSVPKRFSGQAAMFDQEPIELSYFQDWINFDPASFPQDYEYNQTQNLYKNLTPEEFIFRHFSSTQNPLLCHSERNSPEVQLFEQNHFCAVHYFYHGLIARDWFRHWKHYSIESGTESKRLGMYCRDATGSRAYRLDLIRKLTPYKKDLYFKLQDPLLKLDIELGYEFDLSGTEYGPTSSATIVLEDCQKFDIQIVPETLFRTTKTHLTEKVFKPIVMQQPFIVVGCPGSLEYLKSYGFKTFGNCWDESYDDETDADKRMDMIVNVINDITELSANDYNNMLLELRSVTEYNRKHFFSDEFESIMLEELHCNLDSALLARDTETALGGTWFMYLDKLHNSGHDITDYNRECIRNIFKYALTNDPKLGRQLMIRFKHLI